MIDQITGMLAGAVGMIFSPLSVLNPAVSLFIVSSIITVLIVTFTRIVTNKKAMDEVKQKMQEIREQLTAAQKIGDNESASKFLKEMMSINSQYMKHMYKGLFVSLIIVALFLPYLGSNYGGMAVASLPFELPVIGTELTWIFWYVLVSFTMGWVLRKLLGMS
jgi:uncharacterized membrane protein (DUF106 family)